MIEMVCVIFDNIVLWYIGQCVFGWLVFGVEVCLVDDEDCDVVNGQLGEMVICYLEVILCCGFFFGYFKDEKVMCDVWCGGWFYIGDMVWQDFDGMFYFVDCKKNIICCLGENIVVVEIEVVLQVYVFVRQVVVLVVLDLVCEEEVFVCIVFIDDVDFVMVDSLLFEYCYVELVYFKMLGWILFVDVLLIIGM